MSESQKIWEALNSYNIYTEEDLKKAINEFGGLDIGVFTTPLNECNA